MTLFSKFLHRKEKAEVAGLNYADRLTRRFEDNLMTMEGLKKKTKKANKMMLHHTDGTLGIGT